MMGGMWAPLPALYIYTPVAHIMVHDHAIQAVARRGRALIRAAGRHEGAQVQLLAIGQPVERGAAGVRGEQQVCACCLAQAWLFGEPGCRTPLPPAADLDTPAITTRQWARPARLTATMLGPTSAAPTCG